MKNNRYHNHIHVLLVLMIMASINMGCIKEDLTGCSFPAEIMVRAAVNIDGVDQEVGDDIVKEVVVYVFDQNNGFLEVIQTEIDSAISLYYPSVNGLNLVFWGNSADEGFSVSTLEIGDKMDEALISSNIASNTKTQSTTQHAGDLFYGAVLIDNNISSSVNLVIKRKVASVSIVSKGLKEYFNATDEEFTYVLRSGKKGINFSGHTTGDDVSHIQKAEFRDGLHSSGIFNILPSADTNIEVDIYKESALIATISTDVNGDPIKAIEGELLNVYAVFKTEETSENAIIHVRVETSTWGQVFIWKDF